MKCCSSSLPNIYTLLKLFATIPLSSCSCEISASALRRLNNYLRCSQTEQRLSALALIHMNYDTDIDIDNVCQIFCNKHPKTRRSKFDIFKILVFSILICSNYNVNISLYLNMTVTLLQESANYMLLCALLNTPKCIRIAL